jgi:antitoxin HigA-1
VSVRAEDVTGLDLSDVATTERIGPVAPGEVLRQEFMAPFGYSGRALAHELGVPSNRITEIIAGECAITVATAILLTERFGTTSVVLAQLASGARSRDRTPAHAPGSLDPGLYPQAATARRAMTPTR